MKKSNLNKYIIILFISLFILIPSINADSVVERFNYYYFFIEEFPIDEDGNYNISKTTSNTVFYPIELGGIPDEDNSKIIPVKRSCPAVDEDKEICLSYTSFYDKYLDVEKNGKYEEYKDQNDNTNISQYREINKNNYYLIHGAYQSAFSGTWTTDLRKLADKYDITDAINELSCASLGVNTPATDEPQCTGDVSCVENQSGDKYQYSKFKITRVPFLEYSIKNEYMETAIHQSNCANNLSIYPIEYKPKACVREDGECKIVEKEKDGKTVYEVEYKKDASGNFIYETVSDDEEKKVFSPVLYKYVFNVSEHKCIIDPPNGNGKCNSYETLTSNCSGDDRVTITTENARADVTINQTGAIANILTPETVYQGGGIKFGFVYRNEISWNYYDGIEFINIDESEARREIKDKMEGKLKPNFLDQISLTMKINNTPVTFEMQKECEQPGSFEAGGTFTTVCTFYLPNAIVDEYSGNISYSIASGSNFGINNKHYTPLNYTGDYKFEVELGNLSVIKNGDGINIGDWTLTFGDDEDDNCSVNVYELYNKPKFIYRPIDLNNPFPNRNAGINWYDWYSDENNQDELKNTYDDLEYTFILDNENLSNIKRYNNQKDEDEEGYFNWNDIDAAGKSTFIDVYGVREGDAS